MNELFFEGTRIRNTQLIYELFPQSTADNILAIKPRNEQRHDRLIWLPSKNGPFPAKWAYREVQANSFSPTHLQQKEWRVLWRAKIHDRNKLLWKIITSTLPTCNILSTGMPMQDLSWPLCNNEEEISPFIILHLQFLFFLIKKVEISFLRLYIIETTRPNLVNSIYHSEKVSNNSERWRISRSWPSSHSSSLQSPVRPR